MWLVHSSSPNFNIVCGTEGSPRQYKVFHSFDQHVRSKNGNLYDEDSQRGHTNLDGHDREQCVCLPIPEENVENDTEREVQGVHQVCGKYVIFCLSLNISLYTLYIKYIMVFSVFLTFKFNVSLSRVSSTSDTEVYLEKAAAVFLGSIRETSLDTSMQHL